MATVEYLAAPTFDVRTRPNGTVDVTVSVGVREMGSVWQTAELWAELVPLPGGIVWKRHERMVRVFSGPMAAAIEAVKAAHPAMRRD